MNDFFRLLRAALGGASTVVAIGAEEYGRLLKRALLPTLVLVVMAITLVAISEISGRAFFNTVAVLVIGLVVLAWLILGIPVFGAVEIARSITWEPVRRLFGLFSTVMTLILVFAVISIRLPSGVDGMTWGGIILTVFIGLSFFGLRISKAFIALQLIGAGVFAALGLLIPAQISYGVSDRIAEEAAQIGQDLSGRPRELEVSLAVLTGTDPSAPLLFDPKGREPRWWCRVAPETGAGIRCYNRSGRDPYSNDVLVPIAPDIVDAAISRLKMQESVEKAAEIERIEMAKQQRVAADRALADAQEENRKLELGLYQAANLNLNGRSETLSLNIRFGDQFEASLEQHLRQSVGNNAPRAFKDASLQNGVFDRVLMGDAGEIERLNLPQVAQVLVVGELSKTFSPNAAIPGSGSLNYKLRLVGFDTASGGVRFNEVIEATGAGQSLKIAEGRARINLLDQSSSQLKLLLNID